jgi:hypothetical protein
VLEIHLEELGEHSGMKALLNTLSGTFGSARLRFIARHVGVPDTTANHVAVGATFPVMRFADLNDEAEPNTLDVARQRLVDLDLELTKLGWTRCAERGPHWWSLRYQTAEGLARESLGS